MTLWPTRDVAERVAKGVVLGLPVAARADFFAGDGWRDLVDYVLGQLHLAYARGRADERRLFAEGPEGFVHTHGG